MGPTDRAAIFHRNLERGAAKLYGRYRQMVSRLLLTLRGGGRVRPDGSRPTKKNPLTEETNAEMKSINLEAYGGVKKASIFFFIRLEETPRAIHLIHRSAQRGALLWRFCYVLDFFHINFSTKLSPTIFHINKTSKKLFR